MDEETVKQLREVTKDIVRLQEAQKTNSANIAIVTQNVASLVKALQPISVLQSKLGDLTDITKSLTNTLDSLNTHELRITRLEKIVYGTVSLILVTVITAILVNVIPHIGAIQ